MSRSPKSPATRSSGAAASARAAAAATSRKFDVIVWGCTGFTGKLTCEYLKKTYPDLRWAIAGRDAMRVGAVKSALGLPDSVEVLSGDLADQDSLIAITSSTKVLLTTAGPYAKIGTPMLRAAVEGGAHYCDLTGEAPWIRSMADQYHAEAERKKLKIVNCCGFDCIPCDLGTQMLVVEMQRRRLQPQEVRFLAGKTKGGVSGGTLASVFNIFETLPVRELLQLSNPFYLAPRCGTDPASGLPQGPPSMPHTDSGLYRRSSDNMVMGYDRVERSWTMPYVMQAIDTRLVNRSNALSGWSYGRNFVFSERMLVPGFLSAVLGTLALTLFQLLLILPPTRGLLKRVLPSPGQGPNQEMLDTGYFNAALWGTALDESTGKQVLLRGTVEGRNGDPGYRLTAKMISEAAVCLATDQKSLPESYGVLTPSVAMGEVLRERLNHSGIHFKLQQD